MLSIHSKCFYIESIRENILDSVNLVGLGSSGQVLFKKNLNHFDYNTIKRLIRTKDKQLALIGTALSCDVFNHPLNQNFFMKIDTTGAVTAQAVFQYTYNTVNAPALDQFIDFTQHQDSSYFVISDSLLYHLSKTGQFLSKQNTGMTDLHCITAMNNGNLMLNGRISGMLTNVVMTTACSILAQQSTNAMLLKCSQMPSGSFLTLSTLLQLQTLGSSLQALASATNSLPPGLLVRDYDCPADDSIFITGSSTITNTPFHGILSQGLATLALAFAPYTNTFPSGIALNGQHRLNVICPTVSTITTMPFTSFYQFSLNGNFMNKPDIGVASVSVVSASYYLYAPFAVVSLMATVKNYGTDTVKQFYLNYFGPSVHCGRLALHKLCNITIPPNGTVNVPTGSFYGPMPASFPVSVYSFEYCLFTTAPDAQSDANVQNDAGCELVTINIVSIEELSGSDPSLKVYPNPFRDAFIVTAETDIKTVQVFSLLGTLVQEHRVNTTNIVIDGSALEPGIYFIKTTTGRGTGIKKVVRH